MLCRRFFCALVGAFLLILPFASAANAMEPTEQVEQLLVSRGLPFVVHETCADPSGAALSLTQNTDSGENWLICTVGGTVFGAPLSADLYRTGMLTDEHGNNPPAIFAGCFFQDTRGSADDTLGVWEGADHHLTVYCSYDAVDGQIIADDYISSARGTIDAEHYDARIVSEEHTAAIRTFFALLPGLRAEAAYRNIAIDEMF